VAPCRRTEFGSASPGDRHSRFREKKRRKHRAQVSNSDAEYFVEESEKGRRQRASYTHATASAKRAAVSALERASLESGPQMGHKTEQRPLIAALG